MKLGGVLGALLLMPAMSFAGQLHDFSNTYNLKAKGMNVGKVIQTLKLKNKRYSFKSVTNIHVFFIHDKLTELSRGSIKNGKVYPSFYEFLDSKKKLKYSLKPADDRQDNLSYQLQLRLDLMAYNSSLSYPVTILNKQHKPQNISLSFTKPQRVKLQGKSALLLTAVGPNNTTIKYWFAAKNPEQLLQSEDLQGGKITAQASLV